MVIKEIYHKGKRFVKRQLTKREDRKYKKEITEVRNQLKDEIYKNRELESLFPGEIKRLRELGRLEFMPYSFVEKYQKEYPFFCDEEKKLCYTFHNGKKLYFPSSDISYCQETYKRLLSEQDKQSPHCYFADEFSVPEGAVFVDCGAAEGIISLEIIDIVSEVFLLECDELWVKALTATFEPYKDKVHLINKYVGETDDEKTITVSSLIKQNGLSECEKFICVKMDIEGMELEAIEGCVDMFKKEKILLSCAAYHVNNFEERVKSLLEKEKIKISNSEGVALFVFGWGCWQNRKYERLQFPYFRKGVVRIKNY